MTPGKAVAFLLLGVLNAYLALWLFGYAASWFLLVLDATTEGQKEVKVRWPDESFRERLWKLGHLAYIALVWLLPIFATFHYNDVPPPLMVLIIGVILWLMLPISLLSSMTSSSHWEIFRWAVLRRLLQRYRTWMAFYAYTFPLLIGCGLVAYLALYGGEALRDEADSALWIIVLPAAALMAATALLIYARLLGRLAWVMDFWDEEVPASAETKPEPTPAAPPRRLWVRGIYRFPWYRSSLLAWFVLTLGGLLWGGLVRWQLWIGK